MAVSNERVQEAIDFHKQGDFSESTKLLSTTLQSMVLELGNELHPELGVLWLIYGVGLFELAVKSRSIVPDTTPSLPSTLPLPRGLVIEESDASIEPSKNDASSSVCKDNHEQPLDSTSTESRDPEEASEQEEEEEDCGEDCGEDGDGDRDEGESLEEEDLETAWECLETARLIFDATKNMNFLAMTHTALGDLSLEQENFQTAHHDYTCALTHLHSLRARSVAPLATWFHLPQPPIERRISEVHYKCALALEYDDNKSDARSHYLSAMTSLKDRLLFLQHAVTSEKQVSNTLLSKEKAKFVEECDSSDPQVEIQELLELIPEIEAKLAEFDVDASTGMGGGASAFSNPLASDSSAPDASDILTKDLTALIKRKRKECDV